MGLIVQPLMAAVLPVKMMKYSTHLSMVIEMAVGLDTFIHTDTHHANLPKRQEDLPKAACHEKGTDESSSEHCDNCANDSCATFCVIDSGVGGDVKVFRLTLV